MTRPTLASCVWMDGNFPGKAGVGPLAWLLCIAHWEYSHFQNLVSPLERGPVLCYVMLCYVMLSYLILSYLILSYLTLPFFYFYVHVYVYFHFLVLVHQVKVTWKSRQIPFLSPCVSGLTPQSPAD